MDSYREFAEHAKVRKFIESDFVIDIWGDVALASYNFEIDYEMRGEELSDSGRDLFLFLREGGRWRALWRTVLPQDEGA